MNCVHLKHYHQNVKRFNHTLLDGAERCTEIKLKRLQGDERVLALRHCVSLLVGRFIATWPHTEPFIDDMVSEAMLAISKMGPTGEVLKTATRRAQQAIEDYLNKNQALAAPSRETQFKRIRSGDDPLYRLTESSEYAEDNHPADPSDEWKRDILETLATLTPKDDIDRALLDPFNWGRTCRDLAEELGVASPTTISRRKQKLYERFIDAS